jgi:hypothetical protein
VGKAESGGDKDGKKEDGVDEGRTMPILEPKKPGGLAIRQDLDGTSPDGYEQGGLVYFTMNGKEMVLVVRERTVFHRYANGGKSLENYVNSVVSDLAYEAAKALEGMIPGTTRTSNAR